MKYLSEIRAEVRQFLRDQFASGVDYTWEDDELDIYIRDCLGEISERWPYGTKETLTTTADSKELDISSIEDLLYVDEVEYRVGYNPQRSRNFSIWGDTLTLDTSFYPEADEDVYLYCAKLHSLTESSSTLKPQLERVLVLGVSARAAQAKARTYINKVNVGGGKTAADLQAWGVNQLALYRQELMRISKPRIFREHSKD